MEEFFRGKGEGEEGALNGRGGKVPSEGRGRKEEEEGGREGRQRSAKKKRTEAPKVVCPAHFNGGVLSPKVLESPNPSSILNRPVGPGVERLQNCQGGK